MSSSTSSSSRAGIAIAASVLAVFVVLEIVTRTWLFGASKDFSRFRGYDARAGELAQAQAYRVALIGNSATEEGFDVGRLEHGLAERLGRPVRVDAFTADGSHLTTWRYMIERYLWRSGRDADLIVVGFFGRSLSDGSRIEIGRLAQFFTGLSDWPEVLSVDLHDGASKAEFVLSSLWATYAARERIRERLFLALFPGYKAYVVDVQAGGPGAPRDAAGAPQSFERLDSLLALAAQHGANLCFVALPTRDGVHEAEAAAPGLAHLAQRGVCHLDLQQRDGIAAEDFRDEIHLLERGRNVLTDRLADALSNLPVTVGAASASLAERPGERSPQSENE